MILTNYGKILRGGLSAGLLKEFYSFLNQKAALYSKHSSPSFFEYVFPFYPWAYPKTALPVFGQVEDIPR